MKRKYLLVNYLFFDILLHQLYNCNYYYLQQLISSGVPFRTKQIAKYGTNDREDNDNENKDCAVLFGQLGNKHLRQQTKTPAVSLLSNPHNCWNRKEFLPAIPKYIPFFSQSLLETKLYVK